MSLNRRRFVQAGIWAAGTTAFIPALAFAQRQSGRKEAGQALDTQDLSALEENIMLALQHEHGAIVQYTNHCGKLLAKEMSRQAEKVQEIIHEEVAHSRTLVSILMENGIEPTLAVWPPQTADTAANMLQQDVKAEQGAIALYQEILAHSEATPDISQRIELILEQEISHELRFNQILKDM